MSIGQLLSSHQVYYPSLPKTVQQEPGICRLKRIVSVVRRFAESDTLRPAAGDYQSLMKLGNWLETNGRLREAEKMKLQAMIAFAQAPCPAKSLARVWETKSRFLLADRKLAAACEAQ